MGSAILSILALVVGSLIFGVGIWQQLPVLTMIGFVIVPLSIIVPLALPSKR